MRGGRTRDRGGGRTVTVRMPDRKKLSVGLVLVISISLAYFLVTSSGFMASSEVSYTSPEALKAKFDYLNSAGTNFCAGPDILESVKSDRLQGACCNPMDFHRYSEQVEGLKKYSGIDVIPSDPYDIPVSLADRLLGYQKSIQLTDEEQAVYDEAMDMSMEGGPCCCKCWRWYAFEGQAKYLIKYNNFDAHQIAELWDTEDGCGGEGHGTDHGGGHT